MTLAPSFPGNFSSQALSHKTVETKFKGRGNILLNRLIVAFKEVGLGILTSMLYDI